MNPRTRVSLLVGVVALIALVTGCSAAEPSDASATPTPQLAASSAAASASPRESGWRTVDDLPVELRDSAAMVWTGEEALVLGGIAGDPCPLTANCIQMPEAQGNAALDPQTGEWREVSEAPGRIVGGEPVFANGRAWVQGDSSELFILYSYDVDLDVWAVEQNVPDLGPGQRLATRGDLLYVFSNSDETGESPDWVFDTVLAEWARLPDDPFDAMFDRSLIPTEHGLVLLAREISRVSGPDPAIVRVALLDADAQEWKILPDAQQIGGWRWVIDGDDLIAPERGGADGGQVNGWGSTYPNGGIITLPSGEWSPLPDGPTFEGAGWGAWIAGQRFSLSGDYIFDAMTRTWQRIDAPPDAPQQVGDLLWMGDELLVVGGTDWPEMFEGVRSPGAWIYTPEF